MSRCFCLSLWTAGLACLTAASTLASDTPQPSTQPSAAAGMIISDGMFQAMLKRTTYEMAYKLDLDDAQKAELDEVVHQRWNAFFTANRDELAPLLDRALQAMYDPTLPSAEEAQQWSRQALKLHDTLLNEVNDSSQDVSKMLTIEQRKKFKKLMAQFHMGLGFMKVELNKMEQGQLADTTWAKRRQKRDARRQRRLEARREEDIEQALASTDLLPVTIAAWDRYVTNFIRKYRLDEAQRQNATTMLAEIKERAKIYVSAREGDIARSVAELRRVDETARRRVLAEHNELLRPLQDLFAELKSRLENIPTEAQRQETNGDQPS